MSRADEIIKLIENLTDEECEKVLKHLRDRLKSNDPIVLGESYNWWDNEEDDVYNEFTQGDVWLANVLFRDKNQSKQRPIVLVGNEI